MSQKHIQSFPPIEAKQAKILILGSIPSVQSLSLGEYYAHKQNAFWWILGQIIGANLTEQPYATRVETVQQHGVCLWDTLASCERTGSLDSQIKNSSIKVNNIPQFLQRHRSIQLIAFNGKKSADTFNRHILAQIDPKINRVTLPSTSPAHASLSKHDKLAIWSDNLAPYLS